MWAKVVALCPSANVPPTITGLLEWRAAVDQRINKRARPILAQRVAAEAELRSATTPRIGCSFWCDLHLVFDCSVFLMACKLSKSAAPPHRPQ